MRVNGRRVTFFAGFVVAAVIASTAWCLRDHLRFRWLFALEGVNAQGLAEYRHRPTGLVFVWIPGGSFEMGSPEEMHLAHR